MTNDKIWFDIDAKAAVPSILIYEEIGFFGVNPSDFNKGVAALGDLKGKPLDVHISCPGGDVFAGNTIYNILKETGAKITVNIEGVAASMGSLICMVGDTINIARNAQFMLHNPSGTTRGESKALRRTAALLDSLRAGMLSAYVERSGLAPEVVSKMMDEETWLDAEEAVALGFADNITEPLRIAAVADFDLSQYRHPPKATIGQFAEAYWQGRRGTPRAVPATGVNSLAPDLAVAKLDVAGIWTKRKAAGGTTARAVVPSEGDR